MERKRILFKVNGEVKVEETRDLFLNEIDEMKWIVASECECSIHDVDVEIEVIKSKEELSEYDVSSDGIVNWKDPYFKTITGVQCITNMDDFLDSMNTKNVAENLELS